MGTIRAESIHREDSFFFSRQVLRQIKIMNYDVYGPKQFEDSLYSISRWKRLTKGETNMRHFLSKSNISRIWRCRTMNYVIFTNCY